jgi:hypothetical protein
MAHYLPKEEGRTTTGHAPTPCTRGSKSKLYYDRRSVGQSVFVSDTRLGSATNILLFFSYLVSCRFVDVGCPLWRVVGSVIYSCCWASPTQSFSVPSPAGLVTKLFLLSQIWDSPNQEGQVPVFISPKIRVDQLSSKLMYAAQGSRCVCRKFWRVWHRLAICGSVYPPSAYPLIVFVLYAVRSYHSSSRGVWKKNSLLILPRIIRPCSITSKMTRLTEKIFLMPFYLQAMPVHSANCV